MTDKVKDSIMAGHPTMKEVYNEYLTKSVALVTPQFHQRGILEFLMVMVMMHLNIIVELPTGSGKSCILNCLALWILRNTDIEKVVIIVSDCFLAT